MRRQGIRVPSGGSRCRPGRTYCVQADEEGSEVHSASQGPPSSTPSSRRPAQTTERSWRVHFPFPRFSFAFCLDAFLSKVPTLAQVLAPRLLQAGVAASADMAVRRLAARVLGPTYANAAVHPVFLSLFSLLSLHCLPLTMTDVEKPIPSSSLPLPPFSTSTLRRGHLATRPRLPSQLGRSPSGPGTPTRAVRRHHNARRISKDACHSPWRSQLWLR